MLGMETELSKMKRGLIYTLSKRFFTSVVLLLLLIVFLFFLLRISPGDPVQKFVSPLLSNKLAENVKVSFGLDKTLGEQFIIFIKNLIVGNFGISYQYRMPVLDVIFMFLPFTLLLASVSFIIQIGFGFYLSFITFKRRGGFLDKLLSRFSLVVYSIPTFVLALVLIYVFSVWLNVLPSADLRSMEFDDFSFLGKISDYVKHLILPVLTLSIPGIIIYYKYLRENMDLENNKNYVKYLRSNGFEENTVLWKHIIPNALGPVVSVAGIELGILLSGALITEVIFNLPGMGRLTINAILNRDFPLIIGCTLVSGVLIIIVNFLADIIRYKIDKRMLVSI